MGLKLLEPNLPSQTTCFPEFCGHTVFFVMPIEDTASLDYISFAHAQTEGTPNRELHVNEIGFL